MRTRIVALVMFLVVCSLGWAQTFEDVVYLTDGSVFRGAIVAEQTFPERAVTLRGPDGQERTFAEAEIERITRERVGTITRAVAGAPREMSTAAWEVNLLGLLQFGPIFRYHMRVSDGIYLSPHIRLGYAGLMYLALDWWPEIGVGSSFLNFWPTGIGPNHLYGGAIVEAQILKGDGTLLNGIGLMGNFGHRWYSPDGGFWQLGVLAGAAYEFEWEDVTVVGMLELAWGADL